MLMKYKMTILFLTFLILPEMSMAQNASDSDRIKAYYSKAMTSLKKSEWREALNNVNSAEQITQQNIAAFEVVRVRAHFGLKDYKSAKRSIAIFKSLNPNESQKKQIVPYVASVNDALSSIQTDYDQRWQEEKSRIAKDEERVKNLERRLETVDVGRQAYKFAKKIRSEITHKNFYGGELYERSEYTGSIYEKGLSQIKYDFINDRSYEVPPKVTRYPYKVLVDESHNEIIQSNRSLTIEESQLNFKIKTQLSVETGVCGVNETGGGGATFYQLKVRLQEPENYSINGSMQARINLSKSNEWPTNVNLLGSYSRCDINTSRDPRNFSTERSLRENLIELHNNYVRKKINRIQTEFTLSDAERLAYLKNEERFKRYFLRTLFTESDKSFSKIDEEVKSLEAYWAAQEEKARQFEIFKQKQLKKISDLKGQVPTFMSTNNFDQAISNYEQIISLNESINEDSGTILESLKELKEKRKIYYQKVYNQLIIEAKSDFQNELLDEAETKIDSVYKIGRSNYGIEKDTDLYDFSSELSSKISGRDRAIKYAQDFDPNDYYRRSYTEERLKLALYYQPNNNEFKEKLEGYYAGEKLKRYLGIIKEGDRLYQNNEFNKALEVYKRAQKVLPNNSLGIRRINSALTKLEVKKDSKAEMIEEINNELQNGDKYDEVFLAVIREKVENYVKDYPEDVELLVAAASLYLNEDLGLEEAFSFSKTAFEIDNNNLLNLKNLGDYYYKKRDFVNAVPLFEKAVELPSPEKAEVLEKLTQSFYTLALRSKDPSLESRAVFYANMALELELDQPVFERVVSRFCPRNENCKK